MRMRKKKHGNERLHLFDDILFAPEKNVGEVQQNFFDGSGDLCLEIGCGKGDFICQLSERNPEVHYVAVEKVADVLVLAMEKYAMSRGVGRQAPNGGWLMPDGQLIPYGNKIPFTDEMKGNVRFVLADCKDLFSMIASNSVKTLYLNFSDPWPQKGHADKRLTHGGFLKEYERILGDQGRLEFKTDNTLLFEFSVESFKEAGWSIDYLTDDLHSQPEAADNIVTEYEKNFSEKGFSIHKLIARPQKLV